MKICRSFGLIFFLSVLIGELSFAQNAPYTTVATIAGAVPGTVTVPVTVVNFTNIGAISLSLDYDYSVLHFNQGTPNPLLPSLTVLDNDLGTGIHRLIIGWFSPCVSLANGSTLLTLTFTYISGTTTLNWYDNGASCEYADCSNNALNDTPQSTYYVNGFVCGALQSPGIINGENNVCSGETGVYYTIAPVPGSSGYAWTVPPGATIILGNNTNSIQVDYSTGASSGVISVDGINACGNGPGSQLPVTVNLLPFANAGIDTTIPYGTFCFLHASNGGTGSYTYHWTPANLLVNPNVQNPQTLNLTTTTIFTVVVSNTVTLCQATDDKVVSISGGPLTTSPEALPDNLCRGEYSQLFANAGGGSGNYSYTWTCTPPGSPAWSSNLPNPQVSPDSTKTYHLQVTDGFNTVSGATALTVFQLPAATITGGDTLCGTVNPATLTVDLIGNPPWNFIYSNGTLTTTVANQLTTPYFIVTNEPGTYTLLQLNDVHCYGNTYGSAVVVVYPVPPAPVITQNGNDLSSTSCCGNQWYLNGSPISGATGQVYSATSSGQFFDIVTIHQCSSDTSNILDVITNIPKTMKSPIETFPNPAHEFLMIHSKELKIQEIFIYSSQGTAIVHEDIHPSNLSSTYEIDVRNFSPGIYVLKVVSEQNSFTERILIW